MNPLYTPFPKQSEVTWPQFGAFSYHVQDVHELIAHCQKYGLSAVQLGSTLLEKVLNNPEEASELRKTLEAHGIYIVALAGYRNLVVPDREKRQTYLTFLKDCLRIAPHLGTRVVATETGTCHPESDWIPSPANQLPETWEQLCEVIGELITTAEEAGTILALEGYVNNIVGTLDQITAILERFPSPHLQLVLDPYNYISLPLLPQSEHVAQEFFQRFKDRFVVAHLKDVDSQGAEVNTPEFGTGFFPQRPYLEFLRDQRPDLPLIMEHLPWENFPAALQRVRTIL